MLIGIGKGRVVRGGRGLVLVVRLLLFVLVLRHGLLLVVLFVLIGGVHSGRAESGIGSREDPVHGLAADPEGLRSAP
ncbi:unnamed protein product [Chondrus crispus]|uniref:Uncharacterized protein n=1 Tax=Chondrus crispus TaxID=2769 RepID=R7QA98_CHOCR|nr:unnamed protein product [Chondrus crispus]CDF35442.1 unnamed protein product [Chondrus crispus]|eukprot:XP_005715261.1 unnamed protein product [Chondrus crispus]